MIKLNKKKEKIVMLGDHDEIVAEVQVAILSLLDNTAKIDKDLAKETYINMIVAVVSAAHLLEDEYDINCLKLLEEYLEAMD